MCLICHIRLIFISGTYQATYQPDILFNAECRSPRIPPARGIPDAHATRGHGARQGVRVTAGSERRGPSDSRALAQRGSYSEGPCSEGPCSGHARAIQCPPPGRHAHECAPLWRCSVGGRGRVSDERRRSGRTGRPRGDEDERTRATWKTDRKAAARTATVAIAATAADTTPAHSTVTAKVTTVAATDDSTCSARHRRAVSNCEAGEGRCVAGSLGRHRAGRRGRRGFHLQIPAARSGW